MTLFLTGSPARCGEDWFTSDNGFLDELRRSLPECPRVLMISAARMVRFTGRSDIGPFFESVTAEES